MIFLLEGTLPYGRVSDPSLDREGELIEWHQTSRSRYYYGLDLSWGMLRRCPSRARRCQGDAAFLPFRDAVFDCVFHVGGINFFDDKQRAIAEMIRVARPGAGILIVDETEGFVRGVYGKIPLLRKHYRNQAEAARCPVELVPTGMREVRTRLLAQENFWCLTFRKPCI